MIVAAWKCGSQCVHFGSGGQKHHESNGFQNYYTWDGGGADGDIYNGIVHRGVSVSHAPTEREPEEMQKRLPHARDKRGKEIPERRDLLTRTRWATGDRLGSAPDERTPRHQRHADIGKPSSYMTPKDREKKGT